MTARQRRWTKADQARLEMALQLDAEANIQYARHVAVVTSRIYGAAPSGRAVCQRTSDAPTEDTSAPGHG
jgi:hypothetical protein